MALLSPLFSLVRAAWQKWYAPRLRLNLPYHRGEPERQLLAIVANGDQWQVVFGLSLRNEGRREARNWRLRFETSDAHTMMFLNRGSDGRSVSETYVGPGWQYEVLSASPSDTVPPGLTVRILGEHTLNFRDKPESVSLKCWTTAEDVSPHEETLILDLGWAGMTALFRSE